MKAPRKSQGTGGGPSPFPFTLSQRSLWSRPLSIFRKISLREAAYKRKWCGQRPRGCGGGPARLQSRACVCRSLGAHGGSAQGKSLSTGPQPPPPPTGAPPEAHHLPPPQPGRRPDVTCTAAGAGGGSASLSVPPPWAPPGRPCGIGESMDGEPWAPPEEQVSTADAEAPSALGTRGPSEPPPRDSGPSLGCVRGVPQSPRGRLSAWL